MSKGINSAFNALTDQFLKQHFITAIRMFGYTAGAAPFDLYYHYNSNPKIVTLDSTNMSNDELPLFGYWVPQGDSCVIEAHPSIRKYVFTPDFSGCSILVDQISSSSYRVYHVQGDSNYLQSEYINSSHSHGLGLAGAMTFDDYGTSSTPRGFAFLKYENKRWWIYYQRQNGVGLSYKNNGFIPIGSQTVLGAGKIPIADLNSEIPATGRTHNSIDLPNARNLKVQKSMVPNDIIF